MQRPRAPLGVTILAYLAFFVALSAMLLGAFALAGGRDAIAQVFLLPGPLVIPALVVAAALVAGTGIGLLRRARWAWLVAILLVGASAVADVARLARRDARGLTGIALVAVVIWYLLRAEVRDWFQ